ncbi:MAG TPA: PqqD family protein [Ktedonobacteraceae bacterium]|nr:PqqD family protein [Ktedonobacteraceae bacterium]
MLSRNTVVLWRELDGEAILLDPQEGYSFNLNKVGTLIWKMLDGKHTIEDITSAICSSYEVTYDQARHDVEQLLNTLREHKLLSESGSRERTSAHS